MRCRRNTFGDRFAWFHRHIDRFSKDGLGVAAVEFALVAPILAFSLIAMVDIGEAVYVKYDVERKLRLTIEGVLRYGDDPAKVLQFANASGASAFDPRKRIGHHHQSLLRLSGHPENFRICR